MIDQELASIIHFVLKSAGDPKPYYWKVPEDFVVPSAFFPPPEIVSGPDTLNSYKFEYAWYIKLFHKSDEDAYVLGRNVTDEIRKIRNLLPLIDENGEAIEGKYIRIRDPKVLLLENGACQLTIEWPSRRPYYLEDSPEVTEEPEVTITNKGAE